MSFAAAVQSLSFSNVSAFVVDPTVGIADPQATDSTWAVWSEEMVTTPEPATLAILGSGAVGLVAARAKRKPTRRPQKP